MGNFFDKMNTICIVFLGSLVFHRDLYIDIYVSDLLFQCEAAVVNGDAELAESVKHAKHDELKRSDEPNADGPDASASTDTNDAKLIDDVAAVAVDGSHAGQQ